MLHLDLETRSTVDLLKQGAHVYWDNLDTEVLVACWALDDGEVQTWWPGDPCPAEIVSHVENGGMVAAHNSQFERLGWWHVLTPRHGWPNIRNEQFYCTATLARARGFPGKLEAAARFAGLPIAKDLDGYRLMLKMCKPRRYDEDGKPVWWEDEEDLQRLAAYCRTDVEVERALANSLLPLTEQELADFHLSERINDRGVRVDVALAEVAVHSAAEEKLSADQTLTRLTHGAVTSHTQVQRIQNWARGRGVELPSLAKGAVLDALSEPLPDDVREVLEIRLEQAKAAVGKFQAVLDRNLDGVLHGMFMFRGAGQTGRFSSTGVQVHNLLRQTAPDATVNIVKARGVAGLRPLGDPVHLLAQMVRLLFIPDDDRLFLVGDYAAIEARIVAWLAGAERLLTGFREGKDVYCDFATEAFGRPITKADGLERFIGKTCILGLGFGGSEGALARGLAQGGLELEPARLTELVQLYRRQYAPEVPALWRALEDAAMLAVSRRGHPQQAGRITFLHDGTHLWCKLPSGRLMCYPFARLVDGPYGDAIQYRRGNRHPRRGEMVWPTVELWYGMMAENCIAEGTLVLTDSGWKPIEAITLADRVHDGEEFVWHQGVVSKGEQECINVDGVCMTPNHEVLTDEGWKQADQVQRPYRPNIRDIDCVVPDPRKENEVGLSVSLREESGESRYGSTSSGKTGLHPELRLPYQATYSPAPRYAWNDTAPSVCGLAFYARPLQAAYASGVEKLRRAWDYGMRALAKLRELLGGHGGHVSRRAHLGPYRQRQGVRTGKLSLDKHKDASQQQTQQSLYQHAMGENDCCSSGGKIRHQARHYPLSARPRLAGRKGGDSTSRVHKPVYDVLNCGPRQRFVVLGNEGPFIVHNCCQAIALDLLVHAMHNMEAANLPVRLHIHDELVVEVDAEQAAERQPEFEQLMVQTPDWAKGLPVAVESAILSRYRKA